MRCWWKLRGVMIVRDQRWMFDAAQCTAMRLAESPYVDCATLRTLKSTVAEQRASAKPAVIQPHLSRQAGHGDTDDNESERTSNDTADAIRSAPGRTALERPRSTYTHRGGQIAGSTADQPAGKQPAQPSKPGAAR
jgi:hypothetical protein